MFHSSYLSLMKYFFSAIVFSFGVQFSFAQSEVKPITGSLPKAAEVNLSDSTAIDYQPSVINIKEQPNPANHLKVKKAELHRQRLAHQPAPTKKNAARGANVEPPVYVSGFNANTPNGTPNDNHMAISNDGRIVSVVNTNIRVYDTLGNLRSNRSLQNFSSSLGTFTNNSDPRVLYDPMADRFIIMFFSGTISTFSKIIVAFSKTNDPAGQWNLYALPGNYLNDTTWSDYPVVSLNKNDLFMTFNQLKDGEGWQTGFRYSIIWQVDKSKGYAGDSLTFNYWSKPMFNGKPIWSICTVMESETFEDDESYFISVRPDALSNDTVFLHTVTNSVASGSAQFSTRVLKSNLAYGLAPNAIQPDGQQLATNDTRSLHAIKHNNKIFYAQNSIVTSSFTAGVYLGTIENPADANPVVTAQIIGFDTLDLGYPSMAHIGKGNADFRTLLTCSYVSKNQFAGTGVFYINNNGEVSDMLVVRKGDNDINVLVDTIERWGDYTGIQRRYNEDFTAWLSGSYGRSNKNYGSWVAKVTVEDTVFISSVKAVPAASNVSVYPNPALDRFAVEFETAKDNLTRISLLDAQGRVVTVLLQDRLKPGINRFSFNTGVLQAGVYTLLIEENGKQHVAKRVVVK